MRSLLHIILVASLVCGLSACGNRSKLKSPTQIEHDQAKKAKKQAKIDKDKADEAAANAAAASPAASSPQEAPAETK